MVVDRGYRDVRRTEVVRSGGVRVVTVGSRGYVERPYWQGYVTRTYVYGGRTNAYVYRTGYYRNYPYYAYVPSVYYRPAYYGGAARPWGVPVAYAWDRTRGGHLQGVLRARGHVCFALVLDYGLHDGRRAERRL